MADQSLKPAKPYSEFPLTPHNSGKWAKKIKGSLYYFGRWDDPDGALREYNAQKDELHAGRMPIVAEIVVTVRDLFDTFLARQHARVEADALDASHFMDTVRNLSHFAKAVGPQRPLSDLAPADFKAARESYAVGRSPRTLNRYLTNVKSAFNFGIKNGLLPGDVRYGDGFNKCAIKAQRKFSRERGYKIGKKVFSAADVKKIIKHAPDPLLAMIYLGLNAGFYAIDIAGLPRAALNLDNAWLEYARAKTEVDRMAPLWPETVKALRKALASRPKARNAADAGLVFLTKYGNRWVHKKIHRDERGISKATRIDAINHAFAKVLTAAGIRRPGVNFSALRHTFTTLANEIRDDNAALLIRGHAMKGMDAHYVQGINRDRLEAITKHVRSQLLEPKKTAGLRSRARAAKRRH